MGKQHKKGEKFKEKQLIHDKEKHRIENFDCARNILREYIDITQAYT